MARPRWATARSPDRRTVGADVARMAYLLGRPLIPWQVELALTAGEVIAPGRFAYPVVVVVVPRRAGKTIEVLATLMQRAQLIDMARCWYTAQRREDAAKIYRDEWAPLIELSPLAAKVTVRKAQGSEGITFRRSRSKVQIFAPTRAALHAANADVVVIDEAWYFDLATGEEIEAGARPAQLTRPWRQTWVVSAGGTELSTYLDRWMIAGRAGVDAGRRDGICYVEFSADPFAPGYDPTDPALWRAVHPALGFHIDERALAEDLDQLDIAAFERSILNVWPRPSEGRANAIDPALWAAAADLDAAPDDPVAFGIDVAPDRSFGAIAVAGRSRRLHAVVVELVEHQRGTSWMAPALRQLRRDHPNAPILGDSLVAASVLAELRRRHLDVVEVGASELARACGAFLDGLIARTLVHRGQGDLDAALDGAARRHLADAWAWSRNRSTVEISALVAVTLAAWGLASRDLGGRPDIGVAT